MLGAFFVYCVSFGQTLSVVHKLLLLQKPWSVLRLEHHYHPLIKTNQHYNKRK